MATLTRWDPFREMMALRSNMDRLFDDSMQSVRSGSGGDGDSVFSLPLDVSEDESEYVVNASVPGIPVEDINITMENNVLTISGSHESEAKKEGAHFVVNERRRGSFRRSLTLPSTIDESNISAECDNGVLTVRIPKAEAAKPKRIQVKANKVIEGQTSDK